MLHNSKAHQRFSLPILVKLSYMKFDKMYYHITRRHEHVFSMALHNGGDWRIETWKRRAYCHVSIRQSQSCVMPFWTHAKYLVAFISYLQMCIKVKHTFIITVYSTQSFGGQYMQANHADVCSGVLSPARAVTAITLWKIWFMTAIGVS